MHALIGQVVQLCGHHPNPPCFQHPHRLESAQTSHQEELGELRDLMSQMQMELDVAERQLQVGDGDWAAASG